MMELHYLVNPTMEKLETEYFLPSLPDGFQLFRHVSGIPSSGNFMQDGYLDLLAARTEGICTEIESRCDGGVMVWSDVDIVFLHNEVPALIREFSRGFDLLFQRDLPLQSPDTCNFGFQVIRRNEATLRFYQRLLEIQRVTLNQHDQDIGNRLLCAFGSPRWGHLPMNFACESNGGMKKGCVLYHANLTLMDSLESKYRLLANALEVAGAATPEDQPQEEEVAEVSCSEWAGRLASLRSTLESLGNVGSGDEHIWVMDEAAFAAEITWDAFFTEFEPCDADLLATEVRVSFEDASWPWWKTLSPPSGMIPALGDQLVAAFTPVMRLSRSAIRVLSEGLAAGWSGHPEVLIPTLILQAGLKIEDIGGTGSFTPPERSGRWYDERTWHWQGPVEHVPGRLHFPVSRQTASLAVGRLERVHVERCVERTSGPRSPNRATACHHLPVDETSTLHRILYVSPVGGAAAELLPGVMAAFLGTGADCWLMQYDDAELAVPEGVRVIRDKGYKWQLALKHLHPDAVAEYDCIFFWDDDLGVSDFDPMRFARIMRTNRLDMAQPAIQSPHGLSHAITRHRPCPPPWRDPDGVTMHPVVGRLTNFVEIMAPVFTRGAWREFYSYLDPENRSGWGYDYIPLGRKGIVDVMPVVHTRAVQSINGASEAEIRRFLDNQGLFRHAPVEQGWLFER